MSSKTKRGNSEKEIKVRQLWSESERAIYAQSVVEEKIRNVEASWIYENWSFQEEREQKV